MMKRVTFFIRCSLVFYAFVVLAYWIFIHPAYMNWGATPGEINMKLPGDQLISANRVVTTRAIHIQATKEKIWPWFAQTGQNRGGFNSYYWLENLFAAKMVNARSIQPEWQNPQPGDTVYFGKNEGYALVSLVQRNKYYSLGGWTFYLQAIDSSNTRFIVRYPSMEIKQSKLMTIYYYGLFEALHFIMETGMMMGIKQKAEEQSTLHASN
jgi:hypothetical protein